MQFLITRGNHVDKKAKLIKAGSTKTPQGDTRVPGDSTFYKGDVIETPNDLTKFNTTRLIKFKPVEN